MVGGVALFVLAVFRGTILQSVATDEIRGRIQGVPVVVAAGGPRLADLTHGTAGAAIGTSWAVSGGGVLTVVATILAALAFPAFWRYRHTDASQQDPLRQPPAASETSP